MSSVLPVLFQNIWFEQDKVWWAWDSKTVSFLWFVLGQRFQLYWPVKVHPMLNLLYKEYENTDVEPFSLPFLNRTGIVVACLHTKNDSKNLFLSSSHILGKRPELGGMQSVSTNTWTLWYLAGGVKIRESKHHHRKLLRKGQWCSLEWERFDLGVENVPP